MSDVKKTQQTKEEYQRLRDAAAAALVNLGVSPWVAWEAVKEVERTRDDTRMAMAMHCVKGVVK